MMSDTKQPAAAASSNAGEKKRSKVSFSDEVLSKDKFGDGNKVHVEEEHGVFLSLLGERKIVTNNNVNSFDEIDVDAAGERMATISFETTDNNYGYSGDDNLLKQKLDGSYKQDGGSIRSAPSESSVATSESSVDFDNLVVKIGLLKIGHRYTMSVPLPHHCWRDEEGDEQQEEYAHGDEVKIIEDSYDEDLKGVIETEDSNCAHDGASSTLSTSPQHYLNISLAAKRRGPYRGRFVLELTRSSQAATSSCIEPDKCIMSVQVDATIMGQDMGTPKLRNGVICRGKIVGYDSDDETEWQGFDS